MFAPNLRAEAYFSTYSLYLLLYYRTLLYYNTNCGNLFPTHHPIPKKEIRAKQILHGEGCGGDGRAYSRGVGGVSRWHISRAYEIVSSHHARGAYHISHPVFQNGFEQRLVIHHNVVLGRKSCSRARARKYGGGG